MPQFPTYRQPFTETEREMERLFLEEQIQDSFRPKYLERGEATFAAPPTNFFQNLVAKPAERSINLGTGPGASLNSGMSLFSRAFFPKGDNDIPLNTVEGQVFLQDGSIKPIGEMSGEDYYNGLEPQVRHIFSTKNVGASQFKDVKTKEEATERFNNIAQSIDMRQKIVRFNERNPGYATVTGIVGFAAEVITDPINLLAFGTGSLLRAGAKAGVASGVKASSNTLARKALAEGTDFLGALSASSRASDDLAGHILNSIKSPKYVTREVVDIDGKVMKVTFEVVEDLGDVRRMRPIAVEREGLVKRTPKALPAGKGTDLVPVTVSRLDGTGDLVVRSTNDLVNIPGKGIIRIGDAIAEGAPAVRRMKSVRNTSGEGLVLIPKKLLEGVPASIKTSTQQLTEGALRSPLSKGQAALLGATEGVIYDIGTQYAEYKNRVDNLGIEEQFAYSYLGGGISAILTGGLAAIGAHMAGKSPRALTNNDVIANSPMSVEGRNIANRVRNGSLAGDARADLITLDAINAAKKWSREAFTPKQFEEIDDLLNNWPANNAEDLGELFHSAPTFKEALDFLHGVKTDVDTELKTLLKGIRDTDIEIKNLKSQGLNVEADKLIKKRAKAEKRRVELVGGFEFRGADSVKFKSLTEDFPLLDVYSAQSDRMHRMRQLLSEPKGSRDVAASGNIKKASYSLFKWLAVLGSQGTPARALQNISKIRDSAIADDLTRMFGAYDPRISNEFFTDIDGTAVISVHDNIGRFSMRDAEFKSTYERLLKNKTKAQRVTIGKEVIQGRTGIRNLEDLSAEAQELLPHISKYYDDIAEMAVGNGALRKRIDNYMNILLREDIDNVDLDNLSGKYANYLRREEFSDVSTKLHYGTLFRMKTINDKGSLVEGSVYTKIPKKKSDLTPEDLVDYKSKLDAALLEEAGDAMSRRSGRTKGSPEDPVVRDEAREVQFRTDNRASRTIEQKFWASDDVLALDLVDVDLNRIVNSYRDGMGSFIARQETLTEVFGEAGRFDDFIKVNKERISKLPNTDPNKRLLDEAVDALENMDKRTTGHNKRAATGLEGLIQPFIDAASSIVQQGIVIPMLNEVTTSVLPKIFRTEDIKLLMKHTSEMFNLKLNRDEMRAFHYGIEMEHGSGRFFGSDAINPSGKWGKGARWWKEHSRKWFGEQFLTTRLKRLNFVSAYGKHTRKLYKVVDKLDNLLGNIDANDPKAFANAARLAGFGGDAALARDVRRLGLHTKSAQRALKRFKEIDPESLYHPQNATRVAFKEQNLELRREMIDLADRLVLLAKEKTDRIIVTRSAGTSLRDNDVIGSAVLQFLTYPTSWFNGFLKRTSEGPNHILVGYLGSYIAGEALASMVRDVAYKGMSPEDVMIDWEENFYEKAGRIMLHTPLAGPWTDMVLSPIVAGATGGQANLGILSGASGSFAEGAVNSLFAAGRQVVKGELPDKNTTRKIMRSSPLLGAPVFTSLVRDSDE